MESLLHKSGLRDLTDVAKWSADTLSAACSTLNLQSGEIVDILSPAVQYCLVAKSTSIYSVYCEAWHPPLHKLSDRQLADALRLSDYLVIDEKASRALIETAAQREIKTNCINALLSEDHRRRVKALVDSVMSRLPGGCRDPDDDVDSYTSTAERHNRMRLRRLLATGEAPILDASDLFIAARWGHLSVIEVAWATGTLLRTKSLQEFFVLYATLQEDCHFAT
jgi:hypothetical protein